nr:ribonuclease H-like domain-containing protein [Tanacetum cinerariifolium]
MEYWITNNDMNIWKVIQNGNNMKMTERDRDGRVIILPPMNTEEHIEVQRESKARTTLLQSIPDDHVADFHYMDDARDIWNAIKARFGGNSKSKKIRKSMLKQEFSEFRIGEAEGWHKGYDRMQKILSQLNQLKAKPEDADINLKFLRALPSSWSQVALTLKTKGGLELLFFDDLYYKLKTLEVDVKGYTTFSSSQSAGPSHSAFVSATSASKKMPYGDSPSYSLTNTYSIPSNFKNGPHRSGNKAGRKIDFDKKEYARAKRGNDKKRYSSFKIKEIGKKEEDSKALITVDTLVDWTDHDSESDGVIAAKEFGLITGCDSEDAIEEGAAKIYNLITGADSEEASTTDGAGEFALMGVTFEVHTCPFGCDNKYNELHEQYNELNEQNGEYCIQVQAYKNSLKTLEKQKRALQRNQVTLEDKIRVLSIELENTSNLLKHSEKINTDVETAKKDLQTKLDNHLVQTKKENELGWDDSAFSVFTTNSKDVEGRPIFHRAAKADTMKAVPPPLSGDYTSLSDHIDLDESQISYGTKSSTSCDSKSVSNNFVSCDDSDKYLEVNTNDFASSYSTVKSSEHKPNDSTSCASTYSVSTSVNEAEIESNVGTPIKEPIIVQDLPSFSCNKSDKNMHTSRTSCNKNGYFNKKASHFRKNASFVSKLYFVSGSGTHLIKDCDFYEKKMADKIVVPTGKPKVFAPVPTGRPNRPFPVPTDRGYSPSENPFSAAEDEGIFDSGCSRSMTGNKERLDDFHEFQGGKVTFGGDESIVVLSVPRKHNLYTINLHNPCPRGTLACLVAHSLVDEYVKRHRRMGHVNYKTMNRLVKSKLVRGLPPKLFKNDHTYVACCKGKQHNASYKAINAVKAIRCDNGTKFKNALMIALCGSKGIKREYSNARTLQQNEVAERKNKTLKEAARTMLADSKLPIMFWTEASFKPFGCHVTILNTSDHLSKFNGKADEGYIGLGHEWYFDLDYLTDTLGYKYVQANQSARTQGAATNPAGTQDVDSDSDYNEQVIIVPSYPSYNIQQSEPKDTSGDEVDDSPLHFADEIFQQELSRLKGQTQASAKTVPPGCIPVPTGNVPVPTGNTTVSTDDVLVLTSRSTDSFFDDKPTTRFLSPSDLGNHDPSPGIFSSLSYDDKFGATLNNVTSTVEVSSVATTRINTIHPQYLIIRDPTSAVQTRNKVKQTTTVEPRSVAQALEDPNWVDAMQEEMQQFKFQNVWVLVDLPEASRPDIMFAVSACSRNQVTPTTSNLEAVKKIFKYLKGQPKLGLWYPKESHLVLEAYSDSDYAEANKDRKSTTSGCQFLGRRQKAEVQRRRQQEVLDSTMYYNEANWINIRAQVEANASLSKTLLGDDVSEDNFLARMVALIKRKRQALAEKLAQARQNWPMTQAQQRTYMRQYVKNQSSAVYTTGWTMAYVKSFTDDQLKEEFKKIRKVHSNSQLQAFSRTLKRTGPVIEEPSSKRLKSTKAPIPSVPDVPPSPVVSSPPSLGTRKKSLTRKYLPKPKSTFQELNLDADAQTFIKVVSFEESDDEAPPVWSALVGWEVIPTPLGDINALYRIDQSTKYFTTLRKILHMVDRQDLVKLYGLVVQYYETHPVTGAGLLLSWRLYTLSNVHVLETISGEVLSMFADISYPLSVKIMEKMLTYKLELDSDVVRNDMTTAEQLIQFIKNQLAAAQASSV